MRVAGFIQMLSMVNSYHYPYPPPKKKKANPPRLNDWFQFDYLAKNYHSIYFGGPHGGPLSQVDLQVGGAGGGWTWPTLTGCGDFLSIWNSGFVSWYLQLKSGGTTQTTQASILSMTEIRRLWGYPLGFFSHSTETTAFCKLSNLGGLKGLDGWLNLRILRRHQLLFHWFKLTTFSTT